MAKLYKTVMTAASCLALAALLPSCYSEIELDEYRSDGGKDLLTLNSLVCPDSAVAVAATRTYFFSDVHNDRSYVEGLSIDLNVNGKHVERLTYDNAGKRYVSSFKPAPGDIVELKTPWNGREVSCRDVVPPRCKIEDIKVGRRGPLNIYGSHDFVFSYRLTFSDPPGEDNYYFLQWDWVDRRRDVMMGERDFTRELVFRKLADFIHETFPGWVPYTPWGLPFSDTEIDGDTHSLLVEEIIQASYHTSGYGQMKRKFMLYSISKPYYDYLVSVLMNRTSVEGESNFSGSLIDLGIADPVKVYSNIDNGVGILGCYCLDTLVIDTFDSVGPFPEP